jgi:hypothetical protein
MAAQAIRIWLSACLGPFIFKQAAGSRQLLAVSSL